MLARLSSGVLAALVLLVAIIVGCATVLSATGNPIPSWFETLATLTAGGVLGGYTPAPVAPKPVPPA